MARRSGNSSKGSQSQAGSKRSWDAERILKASKREGIGTNWTKLLADAGIPEPPGRVETIEKIKRQQEARQKFE